MTADLNQAILERKVGFSEEVLLNDAQVAINQALMRLDLVAHRMAVKWGVGRLEDLASAMLRERWDRQAAALNNAVMAADARLVADLVESSIRGWTALEQEAMVHGYCTYQPEFWMVTVNGKVFWVVRDFTDAAALVEKAKIDAAGPSVIVLEELVRVYEAREVKTFPGPSVSVKNDGLVVDATRGWDEEIPF